MTSGTGFGRWAGMIGLLVLTASVTVGAAAPTDTNQQTIENLFAQRATLSGQSARFVEIRTIGELDLPLESRGELQFEPPATLRKKTLEPLIETMELTGSQLSVTINGTTRSLPLEAAPAAAALASALRGLLAGQLADVKEHFELRFRASESSGWTLHLIPTKPAVSKALKLMVVSGTGAQLEQIDIRQTNGDESMMRILPAS